MQIAGASRMTIRTPMNPLEQGFLSKRLEWMLHRSIRLAGLQAVAGIETSGAARGGRSHAGQARRFFARFPR